MSGLYRCTSRVPLGRNAETSWGERMIAKVLWPSVRSGQMTEQGPNHLNWFLRKRSLCTD
jgi:hypothetical protein